MTEQSSPKIFRLPDGAFAHSRKKDKVLGARENLRMEYARRPIKYTTANEAKFIRRTVNKAQCTAACISPVSFSFSLSLSPALLPKRE